MGKHLPAAILANARYGFPSRGLKVIGVSGTDGKTTTVNMIYQVLKAADKKVSMISTINAVIGEQSFETGFHVTSPSRMDTQRLIRQAKKAGSEYLVLEVTSHALDQYRVWGIKFEVGVITNITHEHLDYHKNWENYFQAKAKLIKDVKVAVLNRGETYFERLSKMTKGKVLSFGLTKNAGFNPIKFPLKLKLPGEYNIMNALAATAVCVSLGISADLIKRILTDFSDLPGRMEEVENVKGIKIVIDFAHTPNALEQALKTLRSQTKGKLIAVFGAAGERDRAKRPLMGEVAAKYADLVVLTSEDPRKGDPMKIIKEIVEGYEKGKALSVKGKETLYKEPNRQKAIEMAIKMAKKGDTVGVFGKGHEKSMNIKGKEIPWSEKQAIEKAING